MEEWNCRQSEGRRAAGDKTNAWKRTKVTTGRMYDVLWNKSTECIAWQLNMGCKSRVVNEGGW